jgi:diguanylate cyclase (GGDEF)-like protein
MAALLIGGAVTVAAIVGPAAVLDRRANERFRSAADLASKPILDGARQQINGLQTMAKNSQSGAKTTSFGVWMDSLGWDDQSLFSQVAFVEFVSTKDAITKHGAEMDVLMSDTTDVVPATNEEDRMTMVRNFTKGGATNVRVGSTMERYLKDLGFSQQPLPTDTARFIFAPAVTLQQAGVLPGSSEIQTEDGFVTNETVAQPSSTGASVAVAAIPVPGRGWIISVVRPVEDASNGLVRVVEIGDGENKKTIGGLGVETTGRRTRLSKYEVDLNGLQISISILGAWRYGTPEQTYPIESGIGLGAATLIVASTLGLRQHRRNLKTMTTLVRTAQTQARSDSLTGLANRQGMLDAVAATKPDEGIAVLLADLDRFKNVNDSRGHESGDRLLKSVAERLQTFADTEPYVRCVSRFGGDEFVIVLAGDASHISERAVAFAQQILHLLRTPFALGSDTVVISASLGLAFGTGADTESLVRDADIAMYAAKRSGGSQVRVADDDLRRSGSSQLDLEIGIRNALATGEFVPFFQPIVDEHGDLHSFEALIRWQRPTGELISPAAFLPAAKAAGLLGEVSTWMISAVCPHIYHWNTARVARGEHALTVHINCVEEQLVDLGFPDVVAALLEHHRVDPSWVMLEVSEETALDRIPRGTPTLQALRALGIKFSLDDFGFGNSSLTMLRELGEVAELKLDKSIVDDIAKGAAGGPGGAGMGADNDVVDAILGFAKRRGITIVAEGIEQPEQWDVLKDLGVQLFQGYLFSKPVPSARATEIATNGLRPAITATSISV